MVEHEFDHVFVGRFDGEPVPAAAEVSGWEWVEADALRADLRARPERYTPWFRIFADDAERSAGGPA